MALSIRLALMRKLGKLYEPNRFASLILSCGQKTMYLDAVFCSQEFGIIREAMKAEEEVMAKEADNVIPVCRIDLNKLGLTEKRVSAVCECIALTYMVRIPLSECLSEYAPGFEKCNEELAKLFLEIYPLVDNRKEEEKKKNNQIITMRNFLDAARWLDAKQVLIQADNSISKCIECNCLTYFDLNNLAHVKLSEAVALADEFALSKSWNAVLAIATSVHNSNSIRQTFLCGHCRTSNSVPSSQQVEYGQTFVKDMLESSPPSRMKLKSKYQLLLCLIK